MRVADPLRVQGAPGRPSPVAPAAAVAVRFARLPPERLGELLPQDPDGSTTTSNEEQSLIAFLAWAARNKVIDEYRRAATQKQDIRREERLEAEGDTEDALAAGDTPSQLAQAHETYDRLRELLPEDRRVILELKAAGYSCREIGERLGMSERTVQRVLEDLRDRARLGRLTR